MPLFWNLCRSFPLFPGLCAIIVIHACSHFFTLTHAYSRLVALTRDYYRLFAIDAHKVRAPAGKRRQGAVALQVRLRCALLRAGAAKVRSKHCHSRTRCAQMRAPARRRRQGAVQALPLAHQVHAHAGRLRRGAVQVLPLAHQVRPRCALLRAGAAKVRSKHCHSRQRSAEVWSPHLLLTVCFPLPLSYHLIFSSYPFCHSKISPRYLYRLIYFFRSPWLHEVAQEVSGGCTRFQEVAQEVSGGCTEDR